MDQEKVPKDQECSNAPESPEEGGDNMPIWTILPSYHMYTTILYGNMIDTQDEANHEPPIYERTETNSSGYSVDSSWMSSSSSITTARTSDGGTTNVVLEGNGERLIVADQNLDMWQETVLDNAVKLKNLTGTGNRVSDSVKMQFFLTKEVGEKGVEPNFIDPSIHEYKQGDLINGYLIIENESEQPIAFDMLYVSLEGQTIIDQSPQAGHSQPNVKSFLQMIDFCASWKEAKINRLKSEVTSAVCCGDETDPFDGTYIHIGRRALKPGFKYKRFLTFRIPDKLLDSECDFHNSESHLELPPSLGSNVKSYAPSNVPVNDFSCKNSSIQYNLLARIIGNRSKYHVDEDLKDIDNTKMVNTDGDEFIILHDIKYPFRVVPNTRVLSPIEEATRKKVNLLQLKGIIQEVEDQIKKGENMIRSIEDENYPNVIEASDRMSKELAKKYQLYRPSISDSKNCSEPGVKLTERIFPLIKNNILGKSKSLGAVRLSTPKTTYRIKYIAPQKFRKGPIPNDVINSWNIEIPIDISWYSENDKKVDIKSFDTELVVATFQSEKFKLPIELTHDMMWTRELMSPTATERIDSDNFQKVVKSPMQKLSAELYNVIKKLGSSNFPISVQLIQDVTALCSVREKYMNLEVIDATIKSSDSTKTLSGLSAIPWTKKENSSEYTKSFKLAVNLHSAALKDLSRKGQKVDDAYNRFCLVPEFQSCYVARLYFIRLHFTLTNGNHIYFKVPVTIVK